MSSLACALSSVAPERDNSANFWPPRNRSYEAVIDPCTAYFSGRSVPKLKNGGLFRVAVVASEMDGRMNTENALRRAHTALSTWPSAAQLDPNYVAALGQVDNAVWARRSSG